MVEEKDLDLFDKIQVDVFSSSLPTEESFYLLLDTWDIVSAK